MNKKILAAAVAVSTAAAGITSLPVRAADDEADFFAMLNYKAYPALNLVKEAADKGDYSLAKAELLKYYKERRANGTVLGFDMNKADENYGMAVLPMRNILTGPYEFDMWQSEFTVTGSDYKSYSVDVTDRISAELSNGAVSFMLLAGDKQEFPVYVKSKEYGGNNAPQLVIEYSINGKKRMLQ